MISLLMKPIMFIAVKMAITSSSCSYWFFKEEPKMPEVLKQKTEK